MHQHPLQYPPWHYLSRPVMTTRFGSCCISLPTYSIASCCFLAANNPPCFQTAFTKYRGVICDHRPLHSTRTKACVASVDTALSGDVFVNNSSLRLRQTVVCRVILYPPSPPKRMGAAARRKSRKKLRNPCDMSLIYSCL